MFEAVEEEYKTSAPPTKKPKIEIGQMSLGALKSMIDSEKEKVQKEMEDMEEKVLRRAKRHGDVNNPSNEEVDAAQELEQMTWQDRWMKNRKDKKVQKAAPGASEPREPVMSSSNADEAVSVRKTFLP